MQTIRIILLLTITFSYSSQLPFAKYCRHNSTKECAAVDIWFGQFKNKRMFPMKCLDGKCPEGTYCDENEACWDEVKIDKKFHEMKLFNGEWITTL